MKYPIQISKYLFSINYSYSYSYINTGVVFKILGTSCILALTACSTPLSPAPVTEHYGSRLAGTGEAKDNPISTVVTGINNMNNINNNINNNIKNTASSIKPVATSTNNRIIMPHTVNLEDGKTYLVKKGDTLYSIALENGLSYRELADWNGITNPSYIQADQLLQLSPNYNINNINNINNIDSVNNIQSTIVSNIPNNKVAQSSPIMLPNLGSGTPTVSVLPATNLANSIKNTNTNTNINNNIDNNNNVIKKTNNLTVPIVGISDITWQWPAKGKLLMPYIEGKTKGIDIVGQLADPVWAAADGKVVYAGTALKGYGKMLIIKHNDVYLTAYAHNSALLVKEEALVKRGQKIAEMGHTESDNGQVKLHFEMRRSGKPIDPVKLLPLP